MRERIKILFLFAVILSAGRISAQQIIGESVEGRPLRVYTIEGTGIDSGTNPNGTLVVVGAIHGGYEWNSGLLAWELLEHYRNNTREIPEGFTLHIIPLMNPDGLYKVAGTADPSSLNPADFNRPREELLPGRFNANGVDLNRNFDEEWRSTSYLGRMEVNGGSSPFSEPESRAVRDYIEGINPDAAVFIHSAANTIWYGGLPDNWAPGRRLAEIYSRASGYRVHEDVDDEPRDYPITGTASGYFYTQELPTLTIELSNRTGPETDRNINGMNALIQALSREE